MNFNPVFRMIVCSDIHYGESEKYPEKFDYSGQERDRFEKAVEFAYAYADNCDYNKIDAFAAVGDFVTSGQESEMLAFKASLDKVVRKDTEIMLSMASHEYFYDGVDNATERFVKIFGQQPVCRKTVNGFELVAFSTDDRCQTGPEKQAWLKTELKAACSIDEKKPVFMFYHPQFSDTVYGSAVLWRTSGIMRTVMNYPQIVCFSGHSHAPLNDPRTIHQKHFTSVGTGAIIGVSVCDMDRMPLSPGQSCGRSQLLIVEADADNRVRIQAMDGTNGKFFGDGWTVDCPSDPDSFVYTDSRYATAKAPTFDKNARFSVECKNDTLIIDLDHATDGGARVPGYNFVIRDKNGNIKKQISFSSSYYLYEMPQAEHYECEFDAPAGEYLAECRAQSYFDKLSDKIYAQFKKE